MKKARFYNGKMNVYTSYDRNKFKSSFKKKLKGKKSEDEGLVSMKPT